MRNLKRALSLLLAAAMLIGMMVVGASAVSYSDFSDKDEIVNRDAVSMLTTLGIIEGKPDGSYAPNENVDRAQMAKMISVIMNQGADNSALYVNTPTNLTDVDSNWANGHIKYCYTNGIIAGRGNGTFDPDADVTAVEAAKMLLVAAGYDPAIEGLEGSDWALNTNALAARLGIFRNFTKDVTQPLNRDDAALLIYNALDVEMIQQYQNGYALSYADHRTILSAMYGVYKVEGVVIGNQYAMLDGTEYDDSMMDGKTMLAAGYRIIASTTSNTMVEDPATERDTTFNVETSVDMLGKTVTMYIEKATILSDSEVLGVEINDEANTIITSVANESSMRDLLKGTGVSVDRDTEYYVNYGIVADEDAANDILKVSHKDPVTTNSNGIELEVIDNDNDGAAEYVLWVQEDLATITRLNDRDATLTFSFDNSKDITSYNKGKSIDLEDITLYEGAAEGDVVLVRTYGGHYYVTEPQVVTGEMERYSNKTIDEQWIEVNGKEYKPSFINVTAEDYVENLYAFNIANCDNGENNGVQWDITYNFYLDSNGYIAAFVPAEEVVKNYALVLESGYEPGVIASNASGAVTVLMADGTKGSYDLNFSASARNLGEQISQASYDASKNFGIAELKGFLGTDYVDNSTTRPWDYANGTFTKSGDVANRTDYDSDRAAGYVITYSLDENENLTITSVVGTYDKDAYGAVLGDQSGLASPKNLSDDATFTSDVDAAKTYDGGDGTLYFDTNTTPVDNEAGRAASNDRLAIDRDTVAFYYLGDADGNGTVDDDEYGVAIGYKNMADAGANVKFLAQRVGTTTLADMVLFNCEGPQPEKSYVYILGRNDHSNSGRNISMYGLDEDGQPLNLTITRDNYEAMDLDTTRTQYNKVFAYSTNADGISTLSKTNTDARVLEGYGLLLKNGTVAYTATANYNDSSDGNVNDDNPTQSNYDDAYSMADDVAIWNVTDVEENENAPAGRFATNRVVHAIIILDSNTQEIVTSYVWDIEEDEAPVGGSLSDGVISTNNQTMIYDISNRTITLQNRMAASSTTAVTSLTTDLLFNSLRGDVTGIYERVYGAYRLIEPTGGVYPVVETDMYVGVETDKGMIYYSIQFAKPETPVFSVNLPASSATTVALSVTATVTDGGTLSYQWYQNGTAIPGANSATYTPTTAGSYYVEVTNTRVGMTSNTATSSTCVVGIKVNAAVPSIDTDLTASPNYVGETLTIAASVTDGGTLSYQWYMGSVGSGVPIAGATGNSYTPTTNGTYYVVVTNTNNTVNGTKTQTATSTAANVSPISQIDGTGFSITAPVKDAAISGSTFTCTGVTVGTTTWEGRATPSDGWTPAAGPNFAASTYYAATITMTAKRGYAFDDASTIETNAHSAISGSSDVTAVISGNTLTLVVLFNQTGA